MESDREETSASSEDNLSYDSDTTRSRSPHKKGDNTDGMLREVIETLNEKLAAKEAEVQQLNGILRDMQLSHEEEKKKSEARHQDMARQMDGLHTTVKHLTALLEKMGCGAVIQPKEATAPIAEPPQQAEKMDMDTGAGPSGLKRGATEDAGSPSEEARPPKGKRPATAVVKRSYAQQTAAEPRNKTATTEATENSEEAKTQKIPPIILHKKETWSAVSKQLANKRINHTKARLTTQGIQIHPATIDDFRRTTRLFDEKKLEYHTYSLPEEKQLRVVMRGLPDGIETNEIKDDLAAQGITAQTVERLTCRRTKRTMPLVLIKLPQDQEKVLEVNRCCALVVRVERQRAQQQTTQCFRCQRFGHAQSKCTGEARCVKCGLNHRSNECGKSREQPAQCANCKGAHPANYRGCPSCPKQRGAPRGKTTPRQEPATRTPTTSPTAVSQITKPPQVPKDRASFVEVTRRGKRATPQATPASSQKKETVTMGDAEVALAKMTKMFAAMSQIMQQFSNFGA